MNSIKVSLVSLLILGSLPSFAQDFEADEIAPEIFEIQNLPESEDDNELASIDEVISNVGEVEQQEENIFQDGENLAWRGIDAAEENVIDE
jgi:hypothetical protein